MKKLVIRLLCIILISLPQTPFFAAERPTKIQKTAGAEDNQYPSTFHKVIALTDQIDAHKKTPVVITKAQLQSVNAAYYIDQLNRQRKALVQNLTDKDYVAYLYYRFRGRVFEGDRLSRKEILQDLFPVVISQLIHDYNCAWMTPSITAAQYWQQSKDLVHIKYSCSKPLGLITVTSTSSREDYENPTLLIQLVPQEQLQERSSLYRYAHRKPSARELEELEASKEYSKKTLKLLAQGEFFDIPVLEPIEEGEN